MAIFLWEIPAGGSAASVISAHSWAFVSTANLILQDIQKGTPPKRPWKLVSDGDLWEHFYKAACNKSPSSIRITWVKGHAGHPENERCDQLANEAMDNIECKFSDN